MLLKINGKGEEFESGVTVDKLLKDKGIRSEMVAVELNGAIVEREEYTSTELNEGDEMEYLYYMGGGSYKLVGKARCCRL